MIAGLRAGARKTALLAGLGCAALLSACATAPVPRPTAEETSPRIWNGRLALRVESEPPQSFSAGFTLSGTADEGELSLASPLGNTLAKLRWQAGAATLQQGEQSRNYASLDALAAEVAGTNVPVRALFGWLQGDPTSPPGWSADLGRLHDDGRLTARRLMPLPTAELRLVLDR
ncbi:MAG: outer membrane lipoprotein LolB [Proteobacteria bacterium]|nr:outer membrane lipoprotein LolB [Pseudomonadota bacterium]